MNSLVTPIFSVPENRAPESDVKIIVQTVKETIQQFGVQNFCQSLVDAEVELKLAA